VGHPACIQTVMSNHHGLLAGWAIAIAAVLGAACEPRAEIGEAKAGDAGTAGTGGSSAAGVQGVGGSTTNGGKSASSEAGSAGAGATIVGAGSGGTSVAQSGSGGSDDTAGSSGAAGAPGSDTEPCSNTTWVATASIYCGQFVECFDPNSAVHPPSDAIDSDLETRWGTGQEQDGTEEFIVTFPAPVVISGLEFASPMAPIIDAPTTYVVEYSTNGTSFKPFVPVLTGAGSEATPDATGGGSTLIVPFQATRMRAVKVKQVGTAEGWWWSIWELTVIDCKPG